MEVVGAVVGSLLVEPARLLFGSAYRTIKNISKLQSNFNDLEKEVNNLMTVKAKIEKEVEEADETEREGILSMEQCLTKVNKITSEVNLMQSRMEAPARSFSCCRPYKLSSEVVEKLEEVKQQTLEADDCIKRAAVKKYFLEPVEHIVVTSIEDQPTASKNLVKIIDMLNSNNYRIGIWGMGGVGKTTLVKNLNNKLRSSPAANPFSIVIWAIVSRNSNFRKVQTDIAHRLNLNVKSEESEERIASRLHRRLEKEKKFLLILDDVWDAIDLDLLGVPRPEIDTGSKIILTSRFLDVCREMRTDVNVEVDVLNDREAWQLFGLHSGDVAKLEQIKPISKEVAKECGGLPLALIVVGASMRGKTMVALWKDALTTLQRSTPLIRGVEEKVYKTLKWSYDSLQGEHLQSCFLFCCLYPEDSSIEISELVTYWFAEGLLDERLNYDELVNRGVAIIESLKDSCLLECEDEWSVEMHDVVRDVGIWIASSLEEGGFKSVVQSGMGLDGISKNELSNCCRARRVSFMNNRIERLPDSVIQCPHASTLLLQDNHNLRVVPDLFLEGFKSLKILDLSGSQIKSLPLSLLQLGNIRALLLRGCRYLVELPPLGGLSRLQVLNCSRSGIKALPEDIVKLSNLRQLDLSDTINFEYTRLPGTVSRLFNLELLNLYGNYYPWTAFKELLSLKSLNALNLDLERIPDIASNDISGWRTLQRGRIFLGGVIDRYGPRRRSPGSYDHARRARESSVTLSNLCFSGEWIGLLLIAAASVQIYKCEGLNLMLEKLAINNGSYGCFAALRSLEIRDSHSIFRSGSGGCAADLLPNLEELLVDSLGELNDISDLGDYIGLRFSRLRMITVYRCPKLKHLLRIGGSILTLKSLEKIDIWDCEKLLELFNYGTGNSSHTSAPDPVVPNLKVMKLYNLPNLESLQNETWQHVEVLELHRCNLIRKLPLNAQNAQTVKEIRGELDWWDRLEWEDEDTKLCLQPRFYSSTW